MALKVWMGTFTCSNANVKHSHHLVELQRYLHCDNTYYIAVKMPDIDSRHLNNLETIVVSSLCPGYIEVIMER